MTTYELVHDHASDALRPKNPSLSRQTPANLVDLLVGLDAGQLAQLCVGEGPVALQGGHDPVGVGHDSPVTVLRPSSTWCGHPSGYPTQRVRGRCDTVGRGTGLVGSPGATSKKSLMRAFRDRPKIVVE